MLQIKTFSPKSHKIKCLIYGASWTWKTTFWWSAENVIFASSEDWLLSIADKKVPFAKIETLEQFKQLIDFLKTDEHNFLTLVIDSITDINERIKKSIEEKTWKSMELKMRAELSEKIKWIIFDIKNIDMNIIIISQEKNIIDEDKIDKKIPSLNWKLATDICYFMDIVWYIYIDKEWERKLITGASEKLLTKDRTKSIWNDTELDFKKWVELRNNITDKPEEVLYTIMSNSEKQLIEKKSNFKLNKNNLESSKTMEELAKHYKEMKSTTKDDMKILIKIKDELKNNLTTK